jgi:Ser/Thr protein kinase RdoA (MazF antagonist)
LSLSRTNGAQVEAVVREVLADFRERVVPVIPTLRTSVVQGDLNDANMLVDARGKDISGVIDFGDSLYGCTVFDLGMYLWYNRALAVCLLGSET